MSADHVTNEELFSLYRAFRREASSEGCEGRDADYGRAEFNSRVLRLGEEERLQFAELLRRGFRSSVPGETAHFQEQLRQLLTGTIPPAIEDLAQQYERHLIEERGQA